MHQRAGRGRRRAPKRSPFAIIIGAIGELMLTAGALVLLFVVYLLWGTGLQTAAAQEDLRQQFELEIEDQGSGGSGDAGAQEELDFGDAYGILRIPRFGGDWVEGWMVVEGVEPEDLDDGPGHYPDSADAGELGNFAVAAHRSGHKWPFAQFPELREGDIIEIETRTGVYRYELDDAPNGNSDGNKIAIEDSWVVDPVPGEPPSTEPTEARITLTTCWPRVGSSQRMYATGVLVEADER